MMGGTYNLAEAWRELVSGH